MPPRIRNTGIIVWIIRAALIGIAAAQTVAAQNSMNSDGVSYLWLSDGWLTGNSTVIVNGHWSPLYPLLLAAGRALTDVGPQHEAAVAHVVNFIISCATLLAFEYMLRGLQATGVAFRVVAYSLFAWGALELIGVAIVTPDMLVSLWLFVATGIVLRLLVEPTSVRFVMLGIVLGMGYLSKSIMMPVALIFLLLVVAGSRFTAPLRRRLLTPLLFVVVSAPLVIALSLEKERPTFGDTGRMAYGWYVDRYPWYWTGEPAGSGAPRHPITVLSSSPTAYAFPGSIGASYPFWDDPSYWMDGMRVHFDLRGQLRTSYNVVRGYATTLWAPLLAIVAVVLLVGAAPGIKRFLRDYSPAAIPAAALFPIYALVYAEPRFYGAAAVVLSVAGFAALSSTITDDIERRVASGAMLILSFWLIGRIALNLPHPAGVVSSALRGTPPRHLHWEVASQLRLAGLNSGDRIAVVGYPANTYWARLAGARIVAAVPKSDSSDFWTVSAMSQTRVEQQLARTGVRMIVANGLPANFAYPGWTVFSWRSVAALRLPDIE